MALATRLDRKQRQLAESNRRSAELEKERSVLLEMLERGLNVTSREGEKDGVRAGVDTPSSPWLAWKLEAAEIA